LAWNRAGAAVFGDYARLEGGARNIMHLMSGNLAHGVVLGGRAWPPRRSPCSAPTLRPIGAIRISSGSSPSSPRRAGSSGKGGRRQEIAGHLSGSKRIDHPVAGHILFEHTSFAVSDAEALRLAVYRPSRRE
jgi:hypothetical protein